ncbi:unnamed protein product [Cuscuta epithymum]|uniref:Uncharacterized protein n=1 Tax=Cuscuta epithymum TaxID=186058 RepID=A0AAV0G3G5_9ASTE|nr:unnamed protein product [Cuscuta epithymum]
MTLAFATTPATWCESIYALVFSNLYEDSLKAGYGTGEHGDGRLRLV